MANLDSKSSFIDPNENVPTDLPPSYDDAVKDEFTPTQSPLPPPPPQRPQRPPSQGVYNGNINSGSGSNSSIPHHPDFYNSSSKTSATKPEDLYTNNLDLPFRYPKNYHCKKCKNTGYKLKNGHQCKDCWSKFYKKSKPQQMPRPQPVPPRPFAPNVVQLPPGNVSYGYNYVPQPRMNMYGMQRPGPGPGMMMPPMPNAQQVIVRPGDARIGGYLCPRCNGKGLTHFFLDQETCRVCNGLGRVQAL
ncbi:hypothetical protein B5S33_g1418 [[Candida] boidinii]|nr:hypothetical protein B5S33_g1418 [[Candida] boidinii]